MAQVTFTLPDGSRVRSASSRALILISQWVDPEDGRAYTRIEKRSDSRDTLIAERRRILNRGARRTRWFIGRHADRTVEVVSLWP